MKAIRLVEIGRPLELQEVPVPLPAAGEALVRVRAAGICHSDAHYRAGTSPVAHLPLTLGHEIAGVVEAIGPGVTGLQPGARVCVHYLATCGECEHCSRGHEQFCPRGAMFGKHRDGGYAEYVAVPARSLVPLPEEIPFAHGAVLMCSSATALHALRKGRLAAGETLAVFGVGGLGMSAVQLGRALGALEVYAIDINDDKLRLAARYGAVPVHARRTDPVAELARLTHGRGVDVALELIGLPETMDQAVRALGPMGRAVLVGISARPLAIDTYRDLLGKEAEVIGSNDHLRHELPLLIEFARRGALDLSQVVARTIPLDAAAVNAVLDALDEFRADVRTVIVP